MTVESDAAIVTLLDAITTPVALDSGKNLFLGPLLPPSAHMGQLAVCVTATGGDMNIRTCGSSTDIVRATVQVAVRCDRSDYARGLALARACLRAIHGATPPTGWSDIQVPNQSEPIYTGIQGEGRHAWSINCQLLRST